MPCVPERLESTSLLRPHVHDSIDSGWFVWSVRLVTSVVGLKARGRVQDWSVLRQGREEVDGSKQGELLDSVCHVGDRPFINGPRDFCDQCSEVVD